MRKLITLCAVAFMSLSSLAFAQTSVEEEIITVIAASEDATAAYNELISDENTVLNDDQKAALAALGPVAGAAFLDAIANGSSLNDAGVIAIASGTTEETAGELIAKLSTFDPSSVDEGTDSTDGIVSTNDSDASDSTSDLNTQTAAGSNNTTAPIGSGSTGTGAGSGGGGSTASGN